MSGRVISPIAKKETLQRRHRPLMMARRARRERRRTGKLEKGDTTAACHLLPRRVICSQPSLVSIAFYHETRRYFCSHSQPSLPL
ncbi:hypothetical protein E2C01_013675 [Portunus trituberculatus]|uniref:Uncharacterized protein n=1 Tax=Portunus trituberculatus TaxID=210409 RepID=A0A5B7DGW0_PORTR|nr:hypothetical protein [Portunus trituberculatus]